MIGQAVEGVEGSGFVDAATDVVGNRAKIKRESMLDVRRMTVID